MRRLSPAVLPIILALALVMGTAGVSLAGKPTIGGPCNQCHTAADNVVRGTLGSHSEKFKSININVGTLVWVIKYDNATKVVGADNIAAIPKDKEIAVTFTGDVKTATAKTISVKQPYTVPAQQQADLSYMKDMVAKGGALIVDARPTPRYLEGHIPGAVSLPYADFDRLHDKILPKDKGALVVFYCGGDT